MKKQNYLFFGCRNQRFAEGHQLYTHRWEKADRFYPIQAMFDKILCFPRSEGLYVASITRFEGMGWSAGAWWDETGDNRPGSNSIIWCRSLEISWEGMKLALMRHFPEVWERLPKLEFPSDTRI